MPGSLSTHQARRHEPIMGPALPDRRACRRGYLGGLVGKALYLLLFLPPSPLMAVGLVFLLVWSLLLLVGACAGARIRTR